MRLFRVEVLAAARPNHIENPTSRNMSRLVEAKLKTPPLEGGADFASSDESWQEKLKAYGERVAKYVPAEVIAFYTGATQLILTKEGTDHFKFRLWAFGVVGLLAWIGTPLLLGLYSNDPTTKRANQIIGFIAFGIWAYAYPAGWIAEMKLHDAVIGGLLLLGFTFGIGFYTPQK
jgi:hypothetical protein